MSVTHKGSFSYSLATHAAGLLSVRWTMFKDQGTFGIHPICAWLVMQNVENMFLADPFSYIMYGHSQIKRTTGSLSLVHPFYKATLEFRMETDLSFHCLCA